MKTLSPRYITNITGLLLCIFLTGTSFPIFFASYASSTSYIAFISLLVSAFIAQVMFELPSGFIADKFGRWNAMLAGSLSNSIGAVLQLFPNPISEVFALLCFVFAASCFTGAASAYLYELCLKNRHLGHYLRLEAFAQSLQFFSWIATIIYLSYHPIQNHLHLNFLLLTPNLLATVILMIMPKNLPTSLRKQTTSITNFTTHIQQTIQHIFSNKALLTILIGSSISIASANCLSNMLTSHFENYSFLVVAICSGFYMLGCFASPLFFNKYELYNLVRFTKSLFVANMLIMFAVPIIEIFALPLDHIILALILFISFLYAAMVPAVLEILNSEMPPQNRATGISLAFVAKRGFYCLMILISTSNLIHPIIFSFIMIVFSWLVFNWFSGRAQSLRQDYPNLSIQN